MKIGITLGIRENLPRIVLATEWQAGEGGLSVKGIITATILGLVTMLTSDPKPEQKCIMTL